MNKATAFGISVLLSICGSLEPARAGEAWEGIWATSMKDCDDREGPNSITNIEFGVLIGDRLESVIDQYENHCLIDTVKKEGDNIIASSSCYEFWENVEEKKDMTKHVFKLSTRGGNILYIDGSRHIKCRK
ncbi:MULTISPECIES: hypothetical protein [unclassified Xanthobacter]|uniref:hypothetical protein n=1 Tax=unclassified Xanthobacter TaxID=2623496 RepID=UPI001F162ECD|nr:MULTISPECIES: hypothetical protein [unclassified Xanthobacter]